MNKPMTREEIEDFNTYCTSIGGCHECKKIDHTCAKIWQAAAEKYQQKPNTGCSNCVKIFNGSKKIISDMGEVVQEQNSKIKELETNYESACDEFEAFAAAEGYHGIAVGEVMDDGEIMLTGCQGTRYALEKKIKELEKEVESLKPQKKASARCPKCKKIVSANSLDLLTGCCEGGCEQ